jgi:hypothetical protein
VTYARTHQHIATDSAQTRVRHHQDQEPDRPNASGPLGVQVSAINYFTHVVGPPLGKTLSVLQDLTAVVVDHLQLHFYPIVALAPGALKKSHINLFFVQRTSFDSGPQR